MRSATTAADFELARTLFREYATELDVDLCFQGFEEELASLPGKYAPPTGALLLAADQGVVALRQLTADRCEMKRLFVRSGSRSTGLGGDLARAIMAEGRRLGYDEMVLDTLDRLEPAIQLYRRLGFVECEPYYDNPLPGVVFMRASL